MFEHFAFVFFSQKIPVRVPIHYDVPRPYEVIRKVPYTVKVPVDKPWVLPFRLMWHIEINLREKRKVYEYFSPFFKLSYPVPVPKPYEVVHEKPYPVYVEKKIPVEVPVDVPKPFPVKGMCRFATTLMKNRLMIEIKKN